MVVKITLWTQGDMSLQKYRFISERPMECLDEALEEYAAIFDHPPSDARIKIR